MLQLSQHVAPNIYGESFLEFFWKVILSLNVNFDAREIEKKGREDEMK